MGPSMKSPLDNQKANNDDGTRKEQGFNQTNDLPTPCRKCNKTFQTVEERILHFKNSPLHICCQTCEDIVEFEGLLGLYSHIKDHHPHILFCDHRDHPCATVEERRIRTKASPPGFSCQKCDDVVETRSTFSLCSQHKTCSVWYCYTCNHHCNSVGDIKSSQTQHYCRVCHDFDFESDVHLRMHYQSRHPLEYCSLCDTIFGSVEEKVLHIRTSFGHYCCKHCEEVLDFWGLRRHYQSRHALIYCSVCAIVFNSGEERTTHVRTSLGHQCCQHCEEVLLFTKDLRMHYESRHPLLYCSVCDTIFKYVEERTAHLRTSSKHHCCQHCEELLDYLSNKRLRLHQRVHHPSLYCSVCDTHFNSVEESKHFHCQYCEKNLTFKEYAGLCSHRKHCHPSLYCRICEIVFPSVDQSFAHRQEVHHFCIGCHQDLYSALHLHYQGQTCEKLNPPKKEKIPKTRMPRNHYETLGISPDSTHEQIVKAAKEMRVKVHPDRLKRAGGFTEEQERAIDLEAALVGQAADVLSDPALRRMYDMKL